VYFMPPVIRTVRRVATVATVTLLGTALLSTPAQAEEAIVGANSPDAIAGSYIVVFEADSTEADKVAASAKELVGADDVEAVFDSSVAGFAAKISASEARQVAADPAVDFVEQDRIMRLTDVQSNPPWGLDRIDQRSLPLSKSYRTSTRAAGVYAYIIDTGIRKDHQDFGGRAGYGANFVGDGKTYDCNGHGTHVAGTIGGMRYGVAKQAQLRGVRVLGCDGSGSLSDVIDGVDWVTTNAIKPAVVNMSLGGGYSAALNMAVKNSIASGLTYAIAAGNEDTSACSSSPAGVPQAITVGATDIRDRRASFSNYGQCLDIFAPGVNIVSASNVGTTGSSTMSGTSMAAPHVAGAAAMILAKSPYLSPASVHSLIVNRATTGKVVDRGYASPSRLLYTI
jgi:subtilisin family serine protease